MDPRVPAPTGFHILMPPEWRQYPVDETGKRALIATLSERMRQLGRPDLDAQGRTFIELQWRRLKQIRATAFYLPGERDDEVTIPMSIATRQLVAPKGSPFVEAVRAFARSEPERVEVPWGEAFRWRSTATGSGELSEVRTLNLGYAFPLPHTPTDIAERGILFFVNISSLEDTAPDFVEALETLSDSIMDTFRWRE